jgi:hypothetical protein
MKYFPKKDMLILPRTMHIPSRIKGSMARYERGARIQQATRIPNWSVICSSFINEEE